MSALKGIQRIKPNQSTSLDFGDAFLVETISTMDSSLSANGSRISSGSHTNTRTGLLALTWNAFFLLHTNLPPDNHWVLSQAGCCPGAAKPKWPPTVQFSPNHSWIKSSIDYSSQDHLLLTWPVQLVSVSVLFLYFTDRFVSEISCFPHWIRWGKTAQPVITFNIHVCS